MDQKNQLEMNSRVSTKDLIRMLESYDSYNEEEINPAQISIGTILDYIKALQNGFGPKYPDSGFLCVNCKGETGVVDQEDHYDGTYTLSLKCTSCSKEYSHKVSDE